MYIAGRWAISLEGLKFLLKHVRCFSVIKKLKMNLKLFKKNKYPVNTYKTNILKPFLYLVDEVGE